MRCASCGFENPAGAKFCIECGGAVKNSCPSCGFDNLPQAKFCANCGTTLGAVGKPSPAKSRTRKGTQRPRRATPSSRPPATALSRSASPEAERRQLTVMFCDLVGSTPLAEKLDPEELREVVQAYHQVSAEAIDRFDGQVAQHLGDGLLVYFGYPVAHEDDAQRAVRTGLAIVGALQDLPRRLPFSLPQPLQVRIGIHTGLVVVGEVGSGSKREHLALGETPNIAARVQGIAEPNTVVISAATSRLVQGLFECQDRGLQELKGVSTPVPVYRVLRESEAQSRFEVAVSTGLTPLVGRDEELGLLRRRWEQTKAGEGQVVLLNGEPGIGKSRLVQALKEQVITEGATRIEFRCSPFHQNSAFYPIIEHLQRLLQFATHEPPQVKVTKLQQTLAWYRFPQADTLPLLAALLSLPHPESAPPLTLSPQKQKQKTQDALVAWLVEEAEKAAVYCAWEDLHWADPSTLDVLTLFLDQVPMTRLLAMLTFRPEFMPPWGNRSHITQLTLSRLGRPQVEVMVERVTGGRALPSEVLQQIVSKTDGVPLFVEELTKMVLESGLLREEEGRYVGAHGGAPIPPLAIPSTLQDSLMARLDRLSTVREIAQLGATLGREFSYELIRAVSPLDDERLQHGLKQLVEAELVYQRGLVPQAHYLFKHALIQDTAYQSLLKSTRQQYHQQIAQVLEEKFPETKETQPELLAHHYTEAGLIAQAIPYWLRAGQRAVQRSANIEAIGHLTRGLELLKTQPDTPERGQQELMLQLTLGNPVTVTKGYAAPEVEAIYTRAIELCHQLGEPPQLLGALLGLSSFHQLRAEYQIARELREQCLHLAQKGQDPTRLMWAYGTLGLTLFFLGEVALAQDHLEQGITLYDPQKHAPLVSGALSDPGTNSLSYVAQTLWLLGYPDQALKRSQEALTLAQGLSHPYSLAYALNFAGNLYQFRQEWQAVRERTEALLVLAREQGFPVWVAWGTILRGWALTEQGQNEEGIAQIRQGLASWRATGSAVWRPYFLGLLAEAYKKVGQAKEGLEVLAEALATVDKTGERYWEAELYRLKGTLTLQSQASLGQVQGKSQTSQEQSELSKSQILNPKSQDEAEACFLKAIEIARKQQAKSLELRAVMSLSRLWQSQGKKEDARQLLADIYGWFTEGFDTKDLQEAKALLEELH